MKKTTKSLNKLFEKNIEQKWCVSKCKINEQKCRTNIFLGEETAKRDFFRWQRVVGAKEIVNNVWNWI